ncbi:MAG: ligase-associated DNA damage response DEXH box helicase [Phycisphaerales bacterium]
MSTDAPNLTTTRRRPVRAEAAAPAPAPGVESVRTWFATRGWAPFPFQEQAWEAYAAGRSGLINVPTGAGKTYAAYGGPLAELMDELAGAASSGFPAAQRCRGLRLLYLTPLRAVARDIEAALKLPIQDLGLKLRVECRTGDTSTSLRARQRKELPQVLITTPESLSLLLTYPDSADLFRPLRCVILDEWHELMSSKRGTQTELAMARLRRLAPAARTWALSATLANLEEAASAAVGTTDCVASPAVLLRATIDRPITIQTVIPENRGTLPWAGHLGVRMLDDLLRVLDIDRSTLVFTNTRSQAEIWYQAIRWKRPEWRDLMALHHGSIERAERERVERSVKAGDIRLVVCTSSLDLGVDFAPVERVVQIGSPKGVARLMQRAGRSGHRPGAPAHILCVPTHAMELVEVAAVRRAIEEGVIEGRRPFSKPLDVLAQHMVTCALGGGFDEDDLFSEVRTAWSYRDLTREEFSWALALVRDGGGTLRCYPEFNKVARDPVSGRYTVPSPRNAQLHRLNLGTITGDMTVALKYTSGRRIGNIEEYFIATLHPGERFFFAGKTLEFVRLADLEAFVRPARGRSTYTPRWSGTKLPISESLSEEMRRVLDSESRGAGAPPGRSRDRCPTSQPELAAAQPLLTIQRRLSRIPRADEVLVELLETREGHHCFLFPFEGRLVHGGLAALMALRISRLHKSTYTISVNDYGLEVLSAEPLDFESVLTTGLFSPDCLARDAVESINISALARKQFREIARVAGLVFQTYPGARKSGRQVQASSSLLFDVFSEFDPQNLLLEQARREVLERHFEQSRLGRTLARLRDAKLALVRTERPTPLAFPLMIERLGSELSSQSLLERIQRMRTEWESTDEPRARRKRWSWNRA